MRALLKWTSNISLLTSSARATLRPRAGLLRLNWCTCHRFGQPAFGQMQCKSIRGIASRNSTEPRNNANSFQMDFRCLHSDDLGSLYCAKDMLHEWLLHYRTPESSLPNFIQFCWPFVKLSINVSLLKWLVYLHHKI